MVWVLLCKREFCCLWRVLTSVQEAGIWACDLKMDLAEIGMDELDWIDVAQDRCRWSALVK
jgi:hypothetical protein